MIEGDPLVDIRSLRRLSIVVLRGQVISANSSRACARSPTDDLNAGEHRSNRLMTRRYTADADTKKNGGTMRVSYGAAASVLMLITATEVRGQEGVRGVRTALEVRKTLESHYGAITEGFKRNDPAPWLDRLSSDFTLTLFNGDVKDRAWASAYVKQNSKTFEVLELTMRITALEVTGTTATATVEQKSKRAFTDASGRHTLEVGAVQEERWTKAANDWQLQAVREKEVLYLRKDGK